MATTTATVSLSSSDIMNNSIGISKSSTLTTAGTSIGVAETTGLGSRKLAATDKVDLFTFANETITADTAAKVYVKNTGSSSSQYVQVFINSVELGRLYGGDWMFVPWSGGSGEDVEVQPSTTDPVTLEYMAIY